MRNRRVWLVTAAVAGVIALVLIVVVIVELATSPDVQNQLGQNVFRIPGGASLAREVDRNGPLLFRDAIGRDRDIYLDHVDGRRWVAFEARLSSGCQLTLDRTTGELRDCDGQVAATDPPPTRAYRVVVERDGDLVVNLRSPAP